MFMSLTMSMSTISSEAPHCPGEKCTEYSSDNREDPDYEVYFRVD